MGNRAYITVKEPTGKQGTYYTHWNGSLDTWCPIVQVLFDHNITSLVDFQRLLAALELRIEKQDSPDATSWTEENGHYFIDLGARSFRTILEDGTTRVHHNLQDVFNRYVHEKIRPDFKAAHFENYWLPIEQKGAEIFGVTKGF